MESKNIFYPISDECQICKYPDAELSKAALYEKEEKQQETGVNDN